MKKTAQDIMTTPIARCTPETDLGSVAHMMVEHDCGEIPVVDSVDTMVPIGVITDRDIICRSVARGENPLEARAGSCMSTPIVTVPVEATLEQCAQILEDNQIRRLPVVDAEGRCCGMVSQADIAVHGQNRVAAAVLKEVSRPSDSASRVADMTV